MISELRHPKCNPAVRETIEALNSDHIFLSMISIGEIAKGVALLKHSRRKKVLHDWLETLVRSYTDRLLPIDLETSHIWGELTAAAQKIGRIVPASVGLIAASARRHGLHLVTRNTADFEPTGVLLVNPWRSRKTQRN